MDIQSIIAELEAERDRLNSAIAALQGSRDSHRSGKVIAAARKKIAKAAKKRWAKAKAAGKNSL